MNYVAEIHSEPVSGERTQVGSSPVCSPHWVSGCEVDDILELKKKEIPTILYILMKTFSLTASSQYVFISTMTA